MLETAEGCLGQMLLGKGVDSVSSSNGFFYIEAFCEETLLGNCSPVEETGP